MIHELKAWPEYYEAIAMGWKNFELRENDRKFQAGDLLILKEYDPKKYVYTGRQLVRAVSYVLVDFPGLEPGFAILSLC